jgi:hypothetical protein
MLYRVHFQLAATRALRQGLRVGLSRAAELNEFIEALLEAGRRDDLQDPRRFIAGVPERVPLVAGLEDQVTGAGDQFLVPQQRAMVPSRT